MLQIGFCSTGDRCKEEQSGQQGSQKSLRSMEFAGCYLIRNCAVWQQRISSVLKERNTQVQGTHSSPAERTMCFPQVPGAQSRILLHCVGLSRGGRLRGTREESEYGQHPAALGWCFHGCAEFPSTLPVDSCGYIQSHLSYLKNPGSTVLNQKPHP